MDSGHFGLFHVQWVLVGQSGVGPEEQQEDDVAKFKVHVRI